jgi:aspartate aminotransferase
MVQRPGLAASVESVSYSLIRALAEEAMAMDDVLRLYFGESNVPTPQFIKDAAAQALADGFTFYSQNAGLPSLREAIAGTYARLHGVELDPATEIVVTASGTEALHLGIRSVLDPGDEALVLTPAWPNSVAIVALANAVPHEIPQPFAAGRYTIDFDALEAAITPRTRLIAYTSPSNPLGWVATDDDQERLLALCRARGLWLLADEVYERLWYGGAPGSPAPSILRKTSRDDSVIVAQSFSKTYSMTGWRVGWLVAPSDLGVKAGQLNEFVVSHAASFSQKAAEAALAEGEAWVIEMVRDLAVKRRRCLDVLAAVPGIDVPEPDGAFYLFPRIEGLVDSVAFCRRLLHEERVGLAPGAAFGAGGEGSVRLCYAAATETLEAALERIAAFVGAGRHLSGRGVSAL